MKTLLKLTALVVAPVLFSTCSSDDSEISDSQNQIQETEFNISLLEKDVWNVVSPESSRTRALTGDDEIYGLFLFDPSGNKVRGRVAKTTENPSYTFTEPTYTGTYTIYGFTQLKYSSILALEGASVTSATQAIPLSLTDIHLGQTTVNVVAGTYSYSPSVSATPIMAKLELVLSSVPSNITSLTATLPNQASTFTLSGVVAGNTNSQDLTFTYSSTDKTWSTSETLIYPSADDATSMPITITASDGTHTLTYNTSTTTCCKKGVRAKMAGTWSGISVTSALTESAWTTTITEGTIDLGNPTIE